MMFRLDVRTGFYMYPEGHVQLVRWETRTEKRSTLGRGVWRLMDRWAP